MADDELQRRQAVEEARNDEAEVMKARLSVPAPARDGEKEAEFTGKAGIIGLADRLGRRRRVEVDGNTKMSGGLKDREEARIVKKKAIGGAIEESAVEAEAGDTALQLRRCRGGSLQSKRCKPAETFGMGAHSLGEFIIDVAGQRTGRIRIESIETHRGEREYLEIDPRLVHVGDPAGTDVEEFGLQLRKLRGSFPVMRSGCSEKGFRNEVFFNCNGAHGGLDDARASRVSSMLNENSGTGYRFESTSLHRTSSDRTEVKCVESVEAWRMPGGF
jgi:hypothetical protein